MGGIGSIMGRVCAFVETCVFCVLRLERKREEVMDSVTVVRDDERG